MLNQKVACEFSQHESGICEYTFHKSSRQAVNEFLAQNNKVIVNAEDDQTLLVLIDISPSGLPPLAYFLSRVREEMKQHPYRLSSRVAILYKDSRLLGLMDNTVRLITNSKDKTRFFKLENRDQALAWLLEEDSD